MTKTKKTPGVAFYGKVRIPTIGHVEAINTAKNMAKKTGGRLTIGLSHTSNPLNSSQKRVHAEKLFGHPVMTGDEHTKNLFSFLSHLNKSHDELHLVAGSDRAPEYRSTIEKYNGKPDKNGNVLFNFKKWKVHEVEGKREDSDKDPTKMSREELVRSASASKLEKLAKEGNYEHFKAYHPGMPESHIKKVYGQIRKGLTLNEEVTRKELAPMLDSFVSFASDKLGLKSMPNVRYKTNDDDYNSFAAYNPSSNELSVSTLNRHPMDIFRSVAHELVHHKQNEDGRLGKDIAQEGATGSDIENEANSEAGKIMRWFAKANPDMFAKSYVVEETLHEGINDPGKLKAIFLAGGPGSGKDYVMNSVLTGEGLKEINSDVAFEYLMQKNGLDLEMPDEERVERDIVRGRAKNITKEQERLALAGRLGLIINGTADDLEKIKTIKQKLESDGYETMMVFVNTSNEVSRERNVERGKMGKRKVPDGTDKQGVPDNSPNIRQEKWDLAQKNIGELQKIFGNQNFAVLDNTADMRKVAPEEKEKIQTNFNRVRRMAQQFVRADNQNPNAKKWIEREAQKRGITQYQEPKRYKTLTQVRQTVPDVIHKPDNDLMLQARRLGLSYYGFGRFGRKVGNENKVLYHSKGGKLVRVQQMNEEKKMKNDPCWKGYEMIGKKKKNGKEVPNCVPVDEAFEDFINPANREIGTSSLANNYKAATPGQKIVAKKKIKKEEVNPIPTVPAADGLGPEISQYRPMVTHGFTYGIAESIKAWANSEKTQNKFYEKYGDLWEEKLVEAANSLHEAGCGCEHSQERKSVKKIREGLGLGYNDMGTVASQRKSDDINETIRKEGENYVVRSKKGKNLGSSPTREGALKRLRQVEYFKHMKESEELNEREKLKNAAKIASALTIATGLGVSGKYADQKAPRVDLGDKTAYVHTHPGVGTVPNTAKVVKGKDGKKYKVWQSGGEPKTGSTKGWHATPVNEQELNERGADSKGYYRSTESGAGLTRKGAKHFGIKTAVTTPPSKLDPNGKAAKRRKSFCARMGGMPGPMKDEKGRPTRKAMSLRRWNCEE